MKKLLLGLVLLFGVNIYSQNAQVDVGVMTDNKNIISILIQPQNGKGLVGVGIHGNASFIQGGFIVKNRLQIIGGMGIAENTHNIKGNNENYLFLKTNLLLSKNLIIGFGFDNQNRGLYNIGYRFLME